MFNRFMADLHTHPGLPGWRLPDFPKVVEPEVLPRPRSSGRLGAIAIAVGLVLGGLAFVYWKRGRLPGDTDERAMPTVATSGALPAHVAELKTPTTVEEIDRLLETARAWVRMLPDAANQDLARVVWGFHWPGVPFPNPADSTIRPAAAEALEYVARVIATARVEQAEEDVALIERSLAGVHAKTPPATSDRAEASSDEPPEHVTPIREGPSPGSFYVVRRDDTLLGDDGIAARALYEAVTTAARRKGWTHDDAHARAQRLAGKASAQAAYAELIQRSEWNVAARDDLVEGTPLWLPPLRTSRLLDRARRRPVVLDARPWPDGSSRLEPPSTTSPDDLGIRGSEGATVGLSDASRVLLSVV